MDPITRPYFLDITRVHIVVAAICSGVVGTFFGHPLDLIKVRLQAQSHAQQYRGSWDCLVQTVSHDGPAGLFRGIAPPLFGSTVLNVISFSTYSLMNDLQLNYLQRHSHSHSHATTNNNNTTTTTTTINTDNPTTPKLAYYNYGLSGLGVGIFCAPAVCPIEVVKVRMQLDRRETMANEQGKSSIFPRRYNGSWDCFKKILKSEGVLGLYTGFTYTTMRDISYTSTYFLIYEPLKQFLAASFSSMRHKKAKKKESSHPHLHPHPPRTEAAAGFSVLAVVLSGGTSGAIAWSVALPFDCVKTLIQKPTQSPSPSPSVPPQPGASTTTHNHDQQQRQQQQQQQRQHHRPSAWTVVRTQYQQGGLRAFYAGWIPTILRAFAVSGIRFLVYESSAQWLNKMWKKKNS